MKAEEHWFDPPQSDVPPALQLKLARLNLDLAKDLVELSPADYRALVEVRTEQLNQILDAVTASTADAGKAGH